MKIYIRTIPKDLSLTDFEDHFSKYGKINDLTIKPHIGFLNFDSESAAKKALEVPHVIKGKEILIDKGKEFQNPSENTYNMRRNERSHGNYSSSYRRDYNNNKMDHDKRYNSRDECSYCRKCPYHGVKQSFQKERSDEMKKLDKLKIVVQNIPTLRSSYDLKDFARSFNLNPVFAILLSGGRSGILEFSTLEDKMSAISKLNGKSVDGRILKARNFYIDNEEEDKKSEVQEEMEEEERKNSDLIYGDLEKYNKSN